MSPKEMPGAPDGAPETPSNVAGENENSLADKLSKELSNWRRQRRASWPNRSSNGNSPTAQAEPARTIKVHGHETLVVRKPKLASKPGSADAPESD
jgi:hypothetical protein